MRKFEDLKMGRKSELSSKRRNKKDFYFPF